MRTSPKLNRATDQSTVLQRNVLTPSSAIFSDVAPNQNPLVQHTPGHLDCPACLRVRRTLLSSITADLSFTEATEHYLKLRSVAATPGAISARYIRPNTEQDYRQKLGAALLFFGEMTLGEIHWYHMKSYQAARVAGDPPFIRKRRPQESPRPCPAKPKQVNQELRLVKKLKCMAGCWTTQDQEYFEYLQEEESDAERALAPEQQQRWLDVCRSNARFDLILWWSIASFDTLTSTNELRGLQLGNVNLQQRLVRIPWPAAKNRFRHRSIPIENPECLWALERLLARAYDLGSRDPQHYLFPFKITRSKTSHPHRQMTESGIKKLWQEVREAADVRWFRPYDCRHTGATRLAEQGTPVQVIMARMGHCSPKMQQHYTHITEQAQRAWLRGRPIQPIRALTPAAGQFTAAPPDTRYAWPPHYAAPSISAWQPVESSRTAEEWTPVYDR